MRAHFVSLLTAAGLGLLASPAAADEPFTPPRGLRIRLATSSGPLEGTVHAASPSAIDVMVDGGLRTVRREAIARLEVSAGEADYLKRGGIIGGVAGLAFGIAVVARAPSCARCAAGDEDCHRTCGEEWGFVIPIVTAGVGVAAGAGAGHLYRPQRWIEVPLERVKVGAALDGRGARVRVSLSF